MRFFRASRKYLLALLVCAIVLYAGDDVYARARKNDVSSVPVSRMYKMKNRWNETEYSVAGREDQKCIYSLFPHFGYSPCWYLNRHPMQYINIG
jgi:hypothetical protein